MLDLQDLASDLAAAPPSASESYTNIFKLTKEVKRRTDMMTAGRDLHDIHTALQFLVHWDHLSVPSRTYIASPTIYSGDQRMSSGVVLRSAKSRRVLGCDGRLLGILQAAGAP
jgi:hypothetical protein